MVTYILSDIVKVEFGTVLIKFYTIFTSLSILIIILIVVYVWLLLIWYNT